MNTPQLPQHVALAITRRGGHIENVFNGSYAVVDRAGALIESAGDIDTPLFTRSSLKPFQALSLIAHPRVGELNLSPADIALMCASHNGEARHAQRAQALLARIGATAEALQCGVHVPYWYGATNTVVPPTQTWSALHSNCSGKHSGFLLLSHLLADEAKAYLRPDSAVQMAVRRAVAYAAGYGDAVEQMPAGTDGCSAPNFALPLPRLARAFAWLADPSPDVRYGDARVRLFDAMAAHPEMVSGESRHDLDLTRAGGGDWVNKVGAEGVQTLASRKHGVAVVLKIGDGNAAALMVVFCALLKKLGLTDATAQAALERWASPQIKSVAGVEVGRWESLVD